MDTTIPLAYRIASMPAMPPHLPSLKALGITVDPAAVQGRMRLEADTIKTAMKFRLDNVAEFYAGHDRAVWDASEDVPNWAPPFKIFFVEWNEPATWKIHGQIVQNPSQGQVGYLVMAFEVPDHTRNRPDDWLRIIAAFSGAPGGSVDPLARDQVTASLASAKWVLCCSQWSSTGAKPICGNPMWMGLNVSLFVGAEGRLLSRQATGLALALLRVMEEQETADAVWSPIAILGLGLSFCHCKNVSKREQEVKRPSSWHTNTGVPVFKYHVLDIDPMREVLRREGRSDEVGIKKAMHICRGHFAHYTADSPLFGKYVGTFWRPDHVRGQLDKGVVVKDYSVSPKDDPS